MIKSVLVVMLGHFFIRFSLRKVSFYGHHVFALVRISFLEMASYEGNTNVFLKNDHSLLTTNKVTITSKT